MIEIILLFLLISLALYTIFGGADFGAGILEVLTKKEDRPAFRHLINNAIGPVWEANHIWIILVIVILFMAFPVAFSTISTSFHVPLTIMLFGIVLRGCAFTFRHYDAFKDESQDYYSSVFSLASLITPLAQGMIAGGLIMGRIPKMPLSFQEAYLWPWLNLFSFSVGVFLCLLCTLSAATFLLSEDNDPEFKDLLTKRVHQLSVMCFVCGLFVFLSAHHNDFPLLKMFVENPISLSASVIAFALLVFMNLLTLKDTGRNLKRALIIAIITLILTGWWHLQAPYLIGMPNTSAFALSAYEAVAPEAVLRQLIWALIVGSALIFPSLIFLFHTFKFKK